MSGQPRQSAKKSRNPKGEGKTLRKLLPIVCVTLCFYSAFLFFCAIWLLHSNHPLSVSALTVGALCAAAFCSSCFAGTRMKKNGLLTGFLSTLPIHVLLFLLSLIFGGLHADWTMLFTFVILSIVSMLGGVLAVNRREKRKAVQHRAKTRRAK